MSTERYIRLESSQAGPYTASNNNFDVTIPASMNYCDLSRSYLELQIRINTSDPDSASGEGVYVAGLRYKDSVMPLYTPGLIRRAQLDSDLMKGLESISEANVIATNVIALTKSRDEKESLEFQSTFSRYDRFGDKNTIFTSLNKQGTTPSAQVVARVPILLKDLFGLCEISDFNFKPTGDLLLRFQLDIANIEGFVAEPVYVNGDDVDMVPTNGVSVPGLGTLVAGTLYAADDTGTLVGGASTIQAEYKVLTVGAGGLIETFEVTSNGAGYAPGDVLTFTPGAPQPGGGGAATVTVDFTANYTLTTAGPDTLAQLDRFSTGGGKTGAKVAIVGGAPLPKNPLYVAIKSIQVNPTDGNKVDIEFYEDLGSSANIDTAVVTSLRRTLLGNTNPLAGDPALVAGPITQVVLDYEMSNVEFSPFHVGQKVNVSGLKNVNATGAIDAFDTTTIISQILFEISDGKVTLVLADPITTVADGDSLDAIVVLPSWEIDGNVPEVTGIDYIAAACVCVGMSSGDDSDGYQFMSWELEATNGNNNTNLHQQVNLPPNCSSALVLFINNELHSHNANFLNYRCKVDDEFTSDRDVVRDTPLYYDQVNNALINMNMGYRNNTYIVDCFEPDFIAASTTEGIGLSLVPVVAPLSAASKNLQIQVSSDGGGIQSMYIYKRVNKEI